MSEETNRTAFLLGLTELTRKYGIAIGGCGCCGSPFLDDADTADSRSGYSISPSGDRLRWVAPSAAFDWSNHSETIVRKAESGQSK